MWVICVITVAINVGGIPFLVSADTEGKIISKSSEKYLVDFTSGVKNYKLQNKPSDYSKVLVDKNKCVIIE